MYYINSFFLYSLLGFIIESTLFKNTMSVCLALQPGKDGVAALGSVKEVDAGDGRNGHLAVIRVVEVKGEGALPELVAAVKAELVDHAQLRGA